MGVSVIYELSLLNFFRPVSAEMTSHAHPTANCLRPEVTVCRPASAKVDFHCDLAGVLIASFVAPSRPVSASAETVEVEALPRVHAEGPWTRVSVLCVALSTRMRT